MRTNDHNTFIGRPFYVPAGDMFCRCLLFISSLQT